MSAFQDGANAAKAREHFSTHCPYLFKSAGVPLDQFNKAVRPMMNEWFRGWVKQLESEGLNYRFEPLNKETA